jgi:DivIVA domain-containing protein
MGSTFDTVRRGYDRAQVDEHLDRLDADLRILTADRDAAVARAAELAKQVENQRIQLINNERDMARLAAAPPSMEDMGDRLQRMLRLAQDEAAEIRARAETEASELMVRAEADGGVLRDRYQKLLAELDSRRAAMENEHRSLMERSKAEANKIVSEATERSRQAEAEATARREQVEEDFDIAMSARRTEAMRALAEQEATSKAEAERRVASATEEANRRLREATEASTRMVAKAEAEVDRLHTLRARVSLQLRQVRSVLAEAIEAVEPRPDEQPPDAASTPPGAEVTRPVTAAEPPKPATTGDDAIPHSRAEPVAANRG